MRSFKKIIPRTILATNRATFFTGNTSFEPEVEAFRSAAKMFTKEKIAPFALEWDKKHICPTDTMREAGQHGFLGIYVPEELGGSALSRLSAAVIFEELAYGDIGVSAQMSIQNMVNWIIAEYGSEELKKDFCEKLSSGELLGSYCLTEPNSGSDSAGLSTTAKAQGDSLIINGSKMFITGGSVSDIYIVFCLTGEKEISAVIIPKTAEGVSFGKPELKMGWNTSTTSTISFDNVKIPKRNLIGTAGMGFKYAMNGLNGGRINIGACSLGGAQLALDKALDYVKQRKQFGKTISDFQNTQFALAKIQTRITASRLFLYEAAKNLDLDSSEKVSWAAMAKYYVTEECYFAVDEALQLFGGYGYLQEYGVEKVLRDMRVNRILEGTNEIMKLIISRIMIK